MVAYVSLLVIALAVSLDSCSVGMLYGARKIRIPWFSILIVSCCSGAVIWCSMLFGQSLTGWLRPETAKAIGASILVAVGVWAVIQFFLHNRKQKLQDEPADNAVIVETEVKPVRTLIRIELRKLGVIIQILKSPSAADMDRSGNISAMEASLLGIALSLDALGAGVGAAMVGYPPLPTALLIAIAGGFFIFIGLKLGQWLSDVRWMKRITVLPGLFLIVLGIMKLL